MKHRLWKKFWPFFGIVVTILCIDYLGVFINVVEVEYGRYFQHKHEVVVKKNQHNINLKELSKFNYTNIHNNMKACNVQQTYLLLVVKSKINNFFPRRVIRRTWGRNYNFGNITISTIFSLGVKYNSVLMEKIREESGIYNDIVQADFIDTYYNNTLKTIMGLQWVAEHCKTAKFIMFVDDDYYVSVRNLLKFVEHEYSKSFNNLMFAGHVIQSAPHRHKFSKWYISLKEYPYSLWPPYVTAGSFILSRVALMKLYNSILTTPNFRFDDVFLSLSAMRSDIPLTHCKLFYFEKPPYNGPETYKDVISSHGFDDSTYMEEVWRECLQTGYA